MTHLYQEEEEFHDAEGEAEGEAESGDAEDAAGALHAPPGLAPPRGGRGE